MQVQRVQFNTSLTQTLGVNINQRAREKKVAFKGNKQMILLLNPMKIGLV